MATADAVELLLKRFTFHIDPSITDQEEKDVRLPRHPAGRERRDRARARLRRQGREPRLAHEDHEGAARRATEYIEELLRWLSRWDTEYASSSIPRCRSSRRSRSTSTRHAGARSSASSKTSTSRRASTPLDPARAGRRGGRARARRTCSATRRASACAPASPRASPPRLGSSPRPSAMPCRQGASRPRSSLDAARGRCHQAADEVAAAGAATATNSKRQERRRSRHRCRPRRPRPGYSLILGFVGK